jgi:hypothetical protein
MQIIADVSSEQLKMWRTRALVVLFFAIFFPLAFGLSDRDADWALWVTAVATGILALAALGTLIIVFETAKIALSSVDDARKTRHGQLVVDLAKRWDERAVVESQALFGEWENSGLSDLVQVLFNQDVRSPTEEELSDWYTLTLVPDLIETIGVLWSEDAITDAVIYKMWGPLIVSHWHGWQPAIDELRQYDAEFAEASYTYFQKVAERMLRMEQERFAADAAVSLTGGAAPDRDSQADGAPEDGRIAGN